MVFTHWQLHMENQEQKPRKMIHIQVAGEYPAEELEKMVRLFMEASLEPNGVVATPENVTVNNVEIAEDLSGMVLTPKMTAKEVASVVVAVLQGYDVGVGNEPTAAFNDLEDDAKLEILTRIQFVLRFGGLPVTAEGEKLSVRDSIFVATVNSLRTKLALPDGKRVIEVTRIAQKEGEQDAVVSFLDLRQGDIFQYQEMKLVAQSDPYVNWIADPLPTITLDASGYEEAAPVAPEDVKVSASSENHVQSKPSKSKARNRKK